MTSPRFHCDCCGLCCRRIGGIPQLAQFDRGDGVCMHLTPENLCDIYETRPEVCNVEKMYAHFSDLLSRDEYCQLMRKSCEHLKAHSEDLGKAPVAFEIPEDVMKRLGLDKMKFEMSEAIEKTRPMSLPLRLGVTAVGAEVVEDLTRMPHLAVCGGEAGDRAAFMCGLVADMAARWSPNDARLILADGKGRAFATFADLPHLVFPICGGFDAARSAVRWIGAETKRRIDLLASKTCMNIVEFNEVAASPLPFVVIVVSEICDVLETSENAALAIDRITKISRAVGIHLVFSLSESEAVELANVLDACVPSRLVFKTAMPDASKRLLGVADAESMTTGSFLYRNLRAEIPPCRGEVTTHESHIL